MPPWLRSSTRVSIWTAVLGFSVAAASAYPASYLARSAQDRLVAIVTHTLEKRFHRAATSQKLTGIVVLGGGEDRAREALLLVRLYPDVRVILSGPGVDEERLLSSAPELAGRLVIDRRARNTFENALYSRELAQPKINERWVVVTSALHMPRAMGAFQSVGFNAESWPLARGDDRPRVISAQVKHEVFGLVYYRLRARTAVLLPGAAS